MAVINSVLGKMKGKLGNLSTRTTNSQNIIYARAQEVKNPRTNSQMKQRVKLANVVVNYRVLRRFLEAYAFENRDPKRSVYNEFVSANLSSSRVYLTKDAVLAGACVAAPYTISKGTLPMIVVSGLGSAATTNIVATYTPSSDLTIGTFAADLIANNNWIKKGDQLSYVSLEQITGADGLPHVTASISEVILDPTQNMPLSDFLPARAFDVRGGFVAHSEETMTGAFAWVLSRKESGKVRVSTQQLVLSSDEVASLFNDINAAIVSYGSVDVPFLDPTIALGNGGASSDQLVPEIASATISTSTGVKTLGRNMTGYLIDQLPVKVLGSNLTANHTYTAIIDVDYTARQATVTRISDTELSISAYSGSRADEKWSLEIRIDGKKYAVYDGETSMQEG